METPDKDKKIGIRMPLSDGPLESGPTEPEGPQNGDDFPFIPRTKESARGAVFVHDLVKPTHNHWPCYCDWRKSKCPPRDQAENDDRIEDLIQATLELCGETGELGLLIGGAGLNLFYSSPVRESLLDELGDVVFEICWALDAWGLNPLREFTKGGIDRHLIGNGEGYIQRMRSIVEDHLTGPTSGLFCEDQDSDDYRSAVECGLEVLNVLRSQALSVASIAGGTANALKKLLYQGKKAVAKEQALALCSTLSVVRHIAVVALGVTLEDVLAHNIEKLDARFPNGWSPGGGIRT
jgi:hypothetical protein